MVTHFLEVTIRVRLYVADKQHRQSIYFDEDIVCLYFFLASPFSSKI